MRTNMDLSGSKNYKLKLLSKFMSENETIINNKSSLLLSKISKII